MYPRLTASEHGAAFLRAHVASGVAGLDQMLGGGVDRGTSTLLIGPPGTGKSTIALRYAAAAASRGDHAAIFAFEEARALLVDRARGLGIALQTGTGAGQVMIRQIDPGQVSPGQFINMVRDSVEHDGARIIVIDSLNGYLNALPEERALSVQLHELLAYLSNQGVATFLIAAQSGLLGTSHTSIDTSYLADTVVALKNFEHAGKIKKAISVLKKRSGRHEESIREVFMDDRGIHLGEPLQHLRGVITGVPVELRATTGAEPG